MTEVVPEDVDFSTLGTDLDLPENEPDALEIQQSQPYQGGDDDDAPFKGDPRAGSGEYDIDELVKTTSPMAVAGFASFVRTGPPVLDWCAHQHLHPSMWWYRLCLIFSRSSFNAPSKYGRAEWAYYATDNRHTSWPPPASVPLWWTNGTYGHVAVSAGHGYCWSTDFLRTGRVDKVRIASITSGWGQRYRGWSEDINDVRVYNSSWWILDVSNAIHAARHKTKIPNGDKLKKAVAKEVGAGDMNVNNDILGVGFREQYRKLQIKYLKATGQIVTRTSADGIPGRGSLTWLGGRQGFNVH